MTDNATIQAAAQNRIKHALHRAYQDGNTFGDCPCGWSIETCGTDETSRSAVVRAYETHEGDEA